MIFVTVGTHEQPFNRLVKKIDDLKKAGVITEEVIIQKGYTDYNPSCCESFDIIPYEKMQQLFDEARIIITHGGPASFIDALVRQKNPIIVPRQKKFNEHINDHQLIFCKQLNEKGLGLTVVENIDELDKILLNYNESDSSNFVSNNKNFNDKLLELIKGIL